MYAPLSATKDFIGVSSAEYFIFSTRGLEQA